MAFSKRKMAESRALEDDNAIKELPSRSDDLSKTLPEVAFNNYLQGKRHMLVQDYKFAVQSLSTACELYTKHFGELAIECGEVHFLYGKALFRLSQQQAGVLGEALNEDHTEDEEEQGKSSEDDDKESEKNYSDAENSEETFSKEEAEPSESTDSPQGVLEEPVKDFNGKGEQMQIEGTDADVTLNESKQPEQEEELDDLELAWNSLETAKSIFVRQVQGNVEAQLKVSEILQLLAEISMESDNNLAAITDLEESLEIRKHHLKPDDRLLAETYYQMGLAQMLEKMYKEAIHNFNTTMNILNLRIKNLKSTPVTDTVGNFESAEHEKEIEDLESVMSDIKEKILDTKELIEDAAKVKEEIGKKLLESEAKEEAFPALDKTLKPVSNINHLLKRKKPEQDEDKDRDLKRAKVASNVHNGNSKIP